MNAHEETREFEEAASPRRDRDRWLAASKPLAIDDDPDGKTTRRSRRSMHEPHEPTPDADEQRLAFAASRGDRDRAIEAMRALEDVAGQAGRGRDQAWRETVTAALGVLQSALAEQKSSYEDPTSLMAQIAQDDPRLRTWVRQLHHRWNDLAMTAETLAEALRAGDLEDPSAITDIREQLRWLLTALHHHRAREADLIFEGLGIDIAAT